MSILAVIMSTDLAIRPWTPLDRAPCLALFDANTPEWFAVAERAHYAQYLRQGAGGYVVAVEGPRVVGAVGLDLAGKRARIRWLLVHPDRHGRGLGRRLVAHVAARASAAGVAAIDIAASHRSEPFFTRLGAHVISRLEDGWAPGMHRVDMSWPRPAFRAPVPSMSNAKERDTR